MRGSYLHLNNVIVHLFHALNGCNENPCEIKLSDDCESQKDISADNDVHHFKTWMVVSCMMLILQLLLTSDDDNDDHDNDDQCPEKFTEYFALKGSSYHEDCQKA